LYQLPAAAVNTSLRRSSSSCCTCASTLPASDAERCARSRPKALATAACATLLLTGLAVQGFGGHGAGPAAASSRTPYPGVPALAGRPVLGATTFSLAANQSRPWTPPDLGEINAFEHVAKAHAAVRRLEHVRGHRRPAAATAAPDRAGQARPDQRGRHGVGRRQQAAGSAARIGGSRLRAAPGGR